MPQRQHGEAYDNTVARPPGRCNPHPIVLACGGAVPLGATLCVRQRRTHGQAQRHRHAQGLPGFGWSARPPRHTCHHMWS